MGGSFEDDPLTRAMAPPPDETPEQRAAREHQELAARQVSDKIDEQIKNEKAALKKQKKPVKVLLLGQSESGKSTTLKNFQLTYARTAWLEERASWRAVVQLNLVRNVTTILAVISAELDRQAASSSPASPSRGIVPLPAVDDESDGGLPPIELSEKHKLLRLRLAPLKGLQRELEEKLGASSMEAPYIGPARDVYDDDDPHTAAAALAMHPGALVDEGITTKAYAARMPQNDFFVRGTNGWKSALDKIGRTKKGSMSQPAPEKERDDVTELLVTCRDDMRSLWADQNVRDLLKRREVRMDDAPGFFLNDVDRIANKMYTVSDDDVIRARLRTVGVQEHRFVFDEGRAAGTEWYLYDVGGHRSARATWAPYFDTVDAIIFLAPISCFDEKLAEDSRVNRLEDTYLLWKSVSRNKLLAKTQIVLFLNKIDVLNKKLGAGIQLKDHVPSFGDRPNDSATVIKYFQTHFREIAKQYNPEPRAFYVHLTSVVDTKATAATLSVVEEGILRDHLRKADLL